MFLNYNPLCRNTLHSRQEISPLLENLGLDNSKLLKSGSCKLNHILYLNRDRICSKIVFKC